jgi:protein PhnA
MSDMPPCPECSGEYVYEAGDMLNCPECGHEWHKNAIPDESSIIKDANGNVLNDGDSVTVVKDLKVKGSSLVIKVGTKAKNISLIDPDRVHDGYDINCKIDGIGAMKLKSSVVKKN